jgi:transposase-like protein
VKDGLARSVYSRDLKIVAMRALDAGSTTSEIVRKYQLSPKLLERWREELRSKENWPFPVQVGAASIGTGTNLHGRDAGACDGH